jgi:hypothetical protein
MSQVNESKCQPNDPPTRTIWPYVAMSNSISVKWLPNSDPFKPLAVYIGSGDKGASVRDQQVILAESGQPIIFYRLSAHVIGRMLAAVDRLPREQRAVAAEAHRLLTPLFAWLANLYRDAAENAGATAADGWAACESDIQAARQAPATGARSMPLPAPVALAWEVKILERIDQQDRSRLTDAERRWRESWGREAIAVESQSDSEAEAG